MFPGLSRLPDRGCGELEDLVLWSYSVTEKAQWSLLNAARRTFGETVRHGSEPDVAVLTSRALVFVESKLDATNDTSGDAATLAKRLDNPKLYVEGGDRWFAKVFRSNYRTMLTAQRYELMRFWLLGSWMARQLNRHFILCLVMRQQAGLDIPADFQVHVKPDATRRVTRCNWEDIFRFVLRLSPSDVFLDYFRNKSLGYDAEGVLQKAFDI